jgi:hypothetical protein
MPKAHMTFVVSEWGKPYSADRLSKLFRRWADEAGLPKRCRLHGLKKGGMRRLAESGGTAHELMAISGHKTLTEVQRYTEEADRKKLADIWRCLARSCQDQPFVCSIRSAADTRTGVRYGQRMTECCTPPPLVLPPQPDRLPLIREAFRLEWMTIGWMMIEAIVAIASGLDRKQPCSNRLRP